MDTLNAMRTFVAIVDHGTMTAAADALDKSQPAVVRALAALEAHLRVRLLNRTTRRMSLTPEGAAYLESCRQILVDVEAAERAVADEDGELKGHLRVTAPVEFGRRHVMPLVSRFLLEHPALSADVLLVDRNVDIVDEGVDIAVRIGALPDSGFVALRVGRLHRVVCASPALLERTGKPVAPDALSGLPCVRLQTVGRASSWSFRGEPAHYTVKVGGPLSCNQISAAVTACVDGVGFGQFLSYQVADELSSGTLVRVLEEHEIVGIPVNVVYASGRLPTARQKALGAFLRDSLRRRVFEEVR